EPSTDGNCADLPGVRIANRNQGVVGGSSAGYVGDITTYREGGDAVIRTQEATVGQREAAGDVESTNTDGCASVHKGQDIHVRQVADQKRATGHDQRGALDGNGADAISHQAVAGAGDQLAAPGARGQRAELAGTVEQQDIIVGHLVANGDSS